MENDAQHIQQNADGTSGDQLDTQLDTQANDSGLPGGGVGRREEPGRTGVYRLSDDTGASGDAPIVSENAFGQGRRGAAGYDDSGDSEIIQADEVGENVSGDLS